MVCGYSMVESPAKSIVINFPEDMGLTRLFRNARTGKRFLAHEESNGDLICAELNENDETIYAENRVPKEEYNKMLDDWEMEADYNTVNFTFSGGKFVKRERPERL